MKRVFDISFSLIGIIIFFPIILSLFFNLVSRFWKSFICIKKNWENFVEFNLIKLRSMILNADKSGVESTAITIRE